MNSYRMPLGSTYTRLTTSRDGKRVRLTLTDSGRVISAVPVGNKAKRTRTGRRLARLRRKIKR